ncbi:MAG TPA: thioredoxin domain-containing protein [Candidatus Binatia bacterium]
MRHVAAMSMLVLLAGCGTNSEDMKKLQDSQRQILAKLGDLEKKVEQISAKPAAPQAPQIDPNKVYNIPAGNSPFKGPADAPVTLALFSDFQCPFCSQIPGLVDQLLKAYPKEVKFVYKEFPLVTIHQNAMPAARAAVAASKQGKFWEMHDKLFANQRALQADNLKQYAKDIGLDAAKFEQDLASPDVQKEIDDDVRLAQQSQVSGTPTLFLNGKRVTNRTFEGLKQMVEEALKQKS